MSAGSQDSAAALQFYRRGTALRGGGGSAGGGAGAAFAAGTGISGWALTLKTNHAPAPSAAKVTGSPTTRPRTNNITTAAPTPIPVSTTATLSTESQQLLGFVRTCYPRARALERGAECSCS